MKPGSMPDEVWLCANSSRMSILEDRSEKATSKLSGLFVEGGVFVPGRHFYF